MRAIVCRAAFAKVKILCSVIAWVEVDMVDLLPGPQTSANALLNNMGMLESPFTPAVGFNRNSYVSLSSNCGPCRSFLAVEPHAQPFSAPPN